MYYVKPRYKETTVNFIYFVLEANSVFMTDAPPPYPGIGGTAPYADQSGVNNPGPSSFGAWSAPQGAGAASAPYANGAFASAADAKAAEAAASGTVQTGYYDPTKPQTAYIPPGTVSV